jgi:site-specific recombinase XerD
MIEAFVKYLRFQKRLCDHTFVARQNDLARPQILLVNHFPGVAIAQENAESLGPLNVNQEFTAFSAFGRFPVRQEQVKSSPDLHLNNSILKSLRRQKKEGAISVARSCGRLTSSIQDIMNPEVGKKYHRYFFVTRRGKLCNRTLIHFSLEKYLAGSCANKNSSHMMLNTLATHLAKGEEPGGQIGSQQTTVLRKPT